MAQAARPDGPRRGLGTGRGGVEGDRLAVEVRMPGAGTIELTDRAG